MRHSIFICVVLLSTLLLSNQSVAQRSVGPEPLDAAHEINSAAHVSHQGIQNNPGSVDAELAFWLKADAGVTETTGNVSMWMDQSGVDYHFSDAGLTPYVYTSNGINYNPSLRNPDGINRRLANTNPISLQTVVLVTEPDNPDECDNPFSEANTNDEGIRACKVGGTAWEIPGTDEDFSSSNGKGWINGSLAVDPEHNNAPNIVIVESPSVASFDGGIELGDTELSRYWHGAIAEVMGFSETLTQIEREQIVSYLGIKYGITIDHTYISSDNSVLWDATINTTYNNDITGIGRDDAFALHQKQSAQPLDPQIDGDIVIGLGSISTDNTSNTNNFTEDHSFLIWGHDNNSLYDAIPYEGANASARMTRTWKVQETGTIGTVEVRIPTEFESSYLLLSNQNDFTAASEFALNDNGDGTLSAIVDLFDGAFFTFDKPQEPQVISDPSTLFFGDLSIYHSGITREFTIENTSDSALQISSMQILGNHASQFSLIDVDIPKIIASGSKSVFTVHAIPTPFPVPLLDAHIEVINDIENIEIPLVATARTPDVFYVSPTGNDANPGIKTRPWKTIQHAVNQAVPQDTILVEDGIYEGPIIMSRSGEPNAYITLKSINPWGAKIEVLDGEGAQDGIKAVANYLTIDGFELYDPAPEPGHIGNGITIYEAHHVNILNNRIHNFGAAGIQGAFCDHILIENNTVSDNAKYNPTQSSGISIWKAWPVDDEPGYHLIIRNNRSFRNTTITKNSKGNNTDGTGIIIDALWDSKDDEPFPHRTLIENNLVYDNGGSGIHVYRSNNIDVFNNTSYHNLHNKGITGTFRGEYYNHLSRDTNWRNNIAFANPGNGVLRHNRAIFAHKAQVVVYENNITYSTDTTNTYSLTVLDAEITEAYLIENNLIGSNPQFMDAANQDFSLQISSPAINAGSDDIVSLMDINYATRTQGTIDVGAFEFDEDALPVELVSFDALVADQDVKLTWRTASELNNAGFAVELKGSDGSFNQVLFVEGQGTTESEQVYETTLANLSPGAYSIRLKQIDFDGAFEYSPIIDVNIGAANYHLAQSYPNPFNPQTRIQYTLPVRGQATLEVFDLLGRSVQVLVNKQQEAGTHSVVFDASHLPNGTYVYRLTAGSFTETRTMVLLK